MSQQLENAKQLTTPQSWQIPNEANSGALSEENLDKVAGGVNRPDEDYEKK